MKRVLMIATVLGLAARVVPALEEDERHQQAVAEIEKLGGRVAVKAPENDQAYTEVNLFGPRYGRAWKGGDDGVKLLRELDNLTKLRIQYVDRFTDQGMVHLKGLTGLRLLRLTGTQVSNDGLVHLAGLTELEFLGLSSGKFTDRALEHVTGLPNLKSLRLDDAQITDGGLEKLNRGGTLRELEFLSLSGTGVGDVGLSYLSNMEHLERLFLRATRVTDAGLAHLRGLPTLEALTVGDTDVSDKGMGYLGGLTDLRLLYLGNTRLTNEGLRHLRGLKKLESLDLSHTGVGDGGLSDLKALIRLKTLILNGTEVTLDGYTELRQALPGSNILWERATPLRVGERAPELSIDKLLQAPDGAVASWESLKGKVVVLEFWATWCAPCLRAIPHMNELSTTFKDKPVRFIAVSAEKQAVVEGFLKKRPLEGWIGVDTDRSMMASYGVRGIPYTIVVDQTGTIRALTTPTGLTPGALRELLGQGS